MKVVLFDIDDTLIAAPKEMNVEASAKMFRRVFGVRANEEMINNSGKTEKGIITEVLQTYAPQVLQQVGEIPQEAYAVWGEATRDALTVHHPIVLPGVAQLLQALSQNSDIILGLLTGNAVPRAEAKLQFAGIDTFFRDEEGNLQGAFGNEALLRAELITRAQKRLDKGNATYILVDDSRIGAEMAKEYNLPSIFVATGRSTKDELARYVPTVFENFGDGRWKEAVHIIEAFA